MSKSNPLRFDPAREEEYIGALSSNETKIYGMGVIDALYEEHIDNDNRLC